MNASLRQLALVCALIVWNAACLAQQNQQPVSAGAVAAAETALERIQREIIGSWIVDVTGETRTRTLKLRGAEGGSDGVWNLDATYGMTDGGQSAVKAQLRLVSDSYRLEFTTQPGTLVIAEGTSNGTLTGTFTPKGGNARPVKLARISDDELKQRVEGLKASRAALTVKPSPDVPESCARFFGGWAGKWSVDQGPQRLWVLGIKTDCTVQYSYRSTTSNAVPDSLLATEIKRGVLTSPCGDSGTCTFEVHGDEVWANYTNPGGGRNNGVFQKIK